MGRSAFALALAAVLASAGLAAAVAFLLQSGTAGWRQSTVFMALAACAAAAVAGWLRSPAGVLRWDGLRWQWEPGGASPLAGRPEIALDLQSRLLLRWRGERALQLWLWAERKSDPAHWEALRRAVYSRASPPVAPGGEPSAAEQ